MEQQIYLLSDVARILDVQPHRIVYLFASRKLEEVPMIGNRRVFGPADVKRVAEGLGISWEEREYTSKGEE